jgi:hypothetical protein
MRVGIILVTIPGIIITSGTMVILTIITTVIWLGREVVPEIQRGICMIRICKGVNSSISRITVKTGTLTTEKNEVLALQEPLNTGNHYPPNPFSAEAV